MTTPRTKERLRAIEARIERLARGPDGIEAPFVRLMRPLLARLGYAPKVSAAEAQLLLDAIAQRTNPDVPSMLDEKLIFERALIEIEDNVENVERLTIIRKKPLVAYAAWLRRLFEVLIHASRFLDGGDDAALHGAIATARAPLVLPPLAVVATEENEKKRRTQEATPATRLLELDLAAVDHMLAEATSEAEVLGRKRRLLETARQLLLDVSAALPLDETGVEARRVHIAREITRIDRLVAAGINPETTMTHQLREAMSRGERQRLHAILVAQHGIALRVGDVASVTRSRGAIDRLWGKGKFGPADDKARRASLERSAEELFGKAHVDKARAIYAAARKTAERMKDSSDAEAIGIGHTMATYFGSSAIDGLFAAQIAVDGAFEVGGALLPMRIEDVEKRYRAVRHPTDELLLLPATEPNDIPDAAFDDPRTILLDLAAGRLLARRFVEEEQIVHERTVLRGEVRVYVLDGSGSMIGPRARMRDAIVAAELLTLQRRWAETRRLARILFFYRYFDSVVHPIVRVDGPKAIDGAIADVLGTLRQGGTDIETALVASLRVVAEAKGKDPDLERAQVVLVTDGEAKISEENVEAERKKIGIPVGFSVIALGQQNDTLRKLVARQRSRGERAFYHFIPDAALNQVANGQVDDGLAIHVRGDRFVDPKSLAGELGEVVEEMVSLGRAREVAALESLDDQSVANFEIGLDEDELSEGERARARALYRDKRALDRQYHRWFPPVVEEPSAVDIAVPNGDVEATIVVLAAVVDVVSVVQGSELARRADAIALLERLLPDAELTPARYFAVVGAPLVKVCGALKAVHAATSPQR